MRSRSCSRRIASGERRSTGGLQPAKAGQSVAGANGVTETGTAILNRPPRPCNGPLPWWWPWPNPDGPPNRCDCAPWWLPPTGGSTSRKTAVSPDVNPQALRRCLGPVGITGHGVLPAGLQAGAWMMARGLTPQTLYDQFGSISVLAFLWSTAWWPARPYSGHDPPSRRRATGWWQGRA